MSRKLKGRNTSKSLRGALLRHQATEHQKVKVKKREQHESSKGKPTKENLAHKEFQRAKAGSFVPFTKDSTVMLVGEGDFSFAKSLIDENYIKPEDMIVTSFDSGVTELKLKYPNSFENNYAFLVENNVTILFRVDATNLIKSLKISKKSPWSKIVGNKWNGKVLESILFNFPHTGRGIKDQDRNIKEHQTLLHDYFKSCKQLFQLVNNDRKVLDSNRCMGGYSTGSTSDQKIDSEGYGKVILTLFNGEPYDSWQIKILAKENGWKLERSAKFEWSKYPGYHHKRTNSEKDTTKPAKERDAKMYIFEMFNKRKHSKKAIVDDSDSD